MCTHETENKKTIAHICDMALLSELQCLNRQDMDQKGQAVIILLVVLLYSLFLIGG